MDTENKSCCSTSEASNTPEIFEASCPQSNHKGNEVKLVTLKSLLLPLKLVELDPKQTYYFCKDAECEVVYFSQGQQFTKQDLKVKVHQKDLADDVPVCYCFGWTPKLIEASANMTEISISITEHIQAGRCSCEVNNPQGSCCLGNVNAEIERLIEKREIV